MRTAALTVLAALATFVVRSTSADCAPTAGYSTSGVDTIQLFASGGLDPAHLEAAAAAWESNCPDDSGTGFPSFTTAPGDIVVEVEYCDGFSTLASGSCGTALVSTSQGAVTGGTVRLFAFDSSGTPCPLTQVLQHELGHFLGLDNASGAECSNTIMGPQSYNASITWPDEVCSAADAMWSVPGEPSPPPISPPPVEVCDPGHCDTGSSWEPLVLDLNGDGLRTTRLDRPVWFDTDGDGVAERTAWTDPDGEEGFLFYDWNHNGVVDGVRELYGDATPLADGSIARTGVEALAAHDANGDGEITPADGVWGILRLWVDRNHNGYAEREEQAALASAGVISISLAFRRLGPEQAFGLDSNGNWHLFQGIFRQRVVERGPEVVERAVHDVYFKQE
ncbi:MAG TPA: hypothetical protein VFO89_16325 [Thermoanaerobaculia bacterium]|nr:hypothetical protein [Thermoanaerobaculia bacterium]